MVLLETPIVNILVPSTFVQKPRAGCYLLHPPRLQSAFPWFPHSRSRGWGQRSLSVAAVVMDTVRLLRTSLLALELFGLEWRSPLHSWGHLWRFGWMLNYAALHSINSTQEREKRIYCTILAHKCSFVVYTKYTCVCLVLHCGISYQNSCTKTILNDLTIIKQLLGSSPPW